MKQTLFRQTIYSEEFCRLCTEASKIALFCDEHILSLHGDPLYRFLQKQHLTIELFSLPQGEKAKTRRVKEELEDKLLKKGFGKDALFLALGGGAICDAVGFLASTYMRGATLLLIPTTLLAMADAAIGGKTGIDTPLGKNLIGTIYFPKAVWIDEAFLETLPSKEWLSGMGEIIKSSLIADRNLFEQIEEQDSSFHNRTYIAFLLKRCATLKLKLIEQDPHELSIRSILNFGHTIGHALEQASNYTLSHGEAVAIGCLVEGHLSCHLGYLPEQELMRMVSLIKKLGFKKPPLSKHLIEIMRRDKKVRDGQIRFVLLKHIGEVFSSCGIYTHPVQEKAIEQSLYWLNEEL